MWEKGTRPTRAPSAAPVRRTPAPTPVAARLLGLQRTAGNAAVAGMLARRTVVVQRVAAQIGMAPDGATIGELTVRGRPESPFKGTMGDHTTAFVVQAQSVRNAVVGRTPGEAARGILELVDRARSLPGIALAARLGVEHAAALAQARQTVARLAGMVTTLAADDPRLMTTLQSLVTAYLHYRELIPLTTLNIKSVSAGLAGRGKGESGAARAMVGYEQADPETLKVAISGLFDFEGLAVLASQHKREAIPVIAPGIDPDSVIEPILAQHLISISAAYPGSITRAWGLRGGVKAAVRELRATLAPHVVAQKARNVEVYNDRLRGAYERQQKLKDEKAVARPGRHDALRAEYREIGQEVKDYREAVLANGGAPLTRPDPQAGRSRAATTRYGSDADQAAGKRKREAQDPPPKPPKWRERDVEEIPGQPVATQVELDERGVITDLRSEGRPPSAFQGGRMGAHTTAWLVHKDVIRTAVLGKTVPEAIAKLPVLGAHAEVIGFRFRGFGQTVEPPIAAAMRDLVAQAAQIANAHLPLLLQDGVNRILAYINKIPGVALDVTNTKGNREGEWRGILLGRERGRSVDAKTLVAALLGLLDVRSVTDEEERLVFLKNHLVQVERAYPLSYAASGISAMDVATEVLPLLRAKSGQDKKKPKVDKAG
ncbi:hypothetical protein [Phytomonospora endophytica]|uniref:Uncharacterized protein n=1 Tax=Phytomonospora endophytica TaxID=714109 RepID=A0A841FNU8_9ACTN|nr:hypothetical protein [Phytomonospora endophytica]MBB6037775.1 hypothetical protein [Phytomonospora endophytica]GIG67695.1 hypothetical protein Pen01_39900 [Phytomonospora endophytica]